MIIRRRIGTLTLSLGAAVSIACVAPPIAAVAAPGVSQAATVERDFTLRVRWEGANNEGCIPWSDTSLFGRCEVRYKSGNSVGFNNADGLVYWNPGEATGITFAGSERNYISGTVANRKNGDFTVNGFDDPQYGRVADGQKLHLTVTSKDVLPGFVRSTEFVLTGRLQVTPRAVGDNPTTTLPLLFGSS